MVFLTHVLVYGVFLTPCTGLWCVPHSMYWSMVCSSLHVLVYGVFLTPNSGLWCSSPHVLVCDVFLTPCTGLWCVNHSIYWSMMCSSLQIVVCGVFLTHPYYYTYQGSLPLHIQSVAIKIFFIIHPILVISWLQNMEMHYTRATVHG